MLEMEISYSGIGSFIYSLGKVTKWVFFRTWRVANYYTLIFDVNLLLEFLVASFVGSGGWHSSIVLVHVLQN